MECTKVTSSSELREGSKSTSCHGLLETRLYSNCWYLDNLASGDVLCIFTINVYQCKRYN